MNQVTVPVTDVSAAVGFYTRLGLRQIVGGSDTYARFECPDGDSTFSVHLVDEVVVPGQTIVYFECDDLDTVVEDLQANGIEFISTPADMRWLWREARLTDPDGNPICLFYGGLNRRNPPWRLSDSNDR
jgi:catechol 2,3-dioxygenase-like lactoylglutathione lyase family enzyme